MNNQSLKPEIIDGKLSIKLDDMILYQDFNRTKNRISPGKLNGEMLVKAAKIKGINNSDLTVIDGTAGLGDDSFLLAAAGFNVILYEYNPIIYSLLKDGIDRALMDDELNEIARRMTPFYMDFTHLSSPMDSSADIVYLDPMFPQRRKSGLIKKKFQILKNLEKPLNDGEKLLEAGLSLGPKKIVIKRPLKAETLGKLKPSYSLKGSVIRYDVIVL